MLKRARRAKRAGPAVALTRAIEQVLALKGWFVWRNGAAGVREGQRFYRVGTVGLPDLMAVKAGRLLAVEVKAGEDRLRRRQSEVLGLLLTHGARVLVARKVEDVILELQRW